MDLQGGRKPSPGGYRAFASGAPTGTILTVDSYSLLESNSICASMRRNRTVFGADFRKRVRLPSSSRDRVAAVRRST